MNIYSIKTFHKKMVRGLGFVFIPRRWKRNLLHRWWRLVGTAAIDWRGTVVKKLLQHHAVRSDHNQTCCYKVLSCRVLLFSLRRKRILFCRYHLLRVDLWTWHAFLLHYRASCFSKGWHKKDMKLVSSKIFLVWMPFLDGRNILFRWH